MPARLSRLLAAPDLTITREREVDCKEARLSTVHFEKVNLALAVATA